MEKIKKEGFIILSINTPNTRAPKLITEILWQLKQIKNYILVLTPICYMIVTSTTVLSNDRPFRQKLNREMWVHSINQMDQASLYRIFYLNIKDYIFFLAAYRTFFKIGYIIACEVWWNWNNSLFSMRLPWSNARYQLEEVPKKACQLKGSCQLITEWNLSQDRNKEGSQKIFGIDWKWNHNISKHHEVSFERKDCNTGKILYQ